MNLLLPIPYFLYFLCAGFISFFIPGRVVLYNQKNIGLFPKIICSTVLGIVLFAAQGFIFGYLQLRFLTYFYLLFFLAMYVYKKLWKDLLHIKIDRKQIDFVSVALIVVGIFVQVFSYIPNGLQVTQGIILVNHNANDHIWHETLVNELVRRFPPHEPAIAGILLTDYHYWFNLATAELIRVFHLPLFFTQTTGMYLLASVLLGTLAYLLSQKIYPSKLFTRWVIFFFFFSGDAAGWVTLFIVHTMNWNLASLINDATKFLESPPFSYSLIVLFTALYLLIVNKAKLTAKSIIILAILFASIVPFKVYTGIMALGGLGLWSVYYLIKKNVRGTILFVIASILAAAIFLKVSTTGGGLFFLPVDIPRDFINQPSLGLIDWQLRWVIFQDHHNIIRLIQYGFYMSTVYLVTQFGILLLGFFQTRKSLRILSLDIALFFYGSIITSFVLGLFFYQKVGGANIWEFFLPAIYLLAILFSLQLTLFLENRKKIITVIISLLVVIIAIPRFFFTVQAYATSEYFSGFHGVANDELASYNYIQQNTPANSIILTMNQTTYQGYSWYASLFMNRDLFLAGEGVRQIRTETIIDRKNDIQAIDLSRNVKEISGILYKNHISYIYFYGVPRFNVPIQDLPIHSVFANRFATIFKVN